MKTSDSRHLAPRGGTVSNRHRLLRIGWSCLGVLALAVAARGDVSVAELAALSPARPTIPARRFILTDFGAVGDGSAMNTGAFRRAVAAVEHGGGGTLVVPRGVYRTLPFRLCSQLELHLDEGAVIQAPDTFAAYGVPDPSTVTSPEALPAITFPGPLISGRDLHDVAITGRGTIDGSGALWWAWAERPARAQPGRRVYPRANLIVIDGCERLLVADVLLRNSPKFHLVTRRITDLTIERVTVRAPFNAPNTDAIDPGPVTNAVIRGCDIDTGDDDIVVKSGGSRIVIEDCTIAHGHGISIGSETSLGVRDMLVRRCTFRGTDNGIRIKSMRGAGGPVERIHYSDLTLVDVADAIVFDLSYVDNNRPNFKGDPAKVPAIRDVVIENVTITGAKRAGRIIGLPDSRISGVTLRDVTLSAGVDLIVRDADPLATERVVRHIDASIASHRPEPVN